MRNQESQSQTAIQQSRFVFNETVVMKKQGETAEDQNQSQTDFLHGRQLAIHFVHEQALNDGGAH